MNILVLWKSIVRWDCIELSVLIFFWWAPFFQLKLKSFSRSIYDEDFWCFIGENLKVYYWRILTIYLHLLLQTYKNHSEHRKQLVIGWYNKEKHVVLACLLEFTSNKIRTLLPGQHTDILKTSREYHSQDNRYPPDETSCRNHRISFWWQNITYIYAL